MCCCKEREVYGINWIKYYTKEFKQLSKWTEEVHNIAVVVDYFCKTQPDKEECYNLAPIVKYLHHEADLLNAFFIDHEKDIDF